MKLKLIAKVTKKASWDVEDVEEAVGSFYTGDLQEDTEFNSAAEVYDFYKKNDWPKGWNDEYEIDYVNGGNWIGKVKLVDHEGPKPRNYKVTFRLVRDIEDDSWANADSEILEIEEVK